MRLIFYFLLSLLIIGCQNNAVNSNKDIEWTVEDSISADEVTKRLIKEAKEEAAKKAAFDTVGLYLAPIKITSARLVKRDYTSYKDISLSYKNVSNKRISAIRFRWYGLNAFNEPAEMGEYGFLIGFGSGFTDDLLSPGKSSSGTWEIMSRDAKKIILAWPHEVVFADGSKWKVNK